MRFAVDVSHVSIFAGQNHILNKHNVKDESNLIWVSHAITNNNK